MSLFEQKSLLAKLMATENMIIRQSSVPTASFDIVNRVLTVPILDRNLSKELYDLFMGHECGHALWTPLEGMLKAKEEKINMSVLNVVEDSRIERKIKTKYPGIKSSFVKAYKELYEKNFFETEGKDINAYNFIDRVNLHCKIGASLTLPFTEEEKKLLEEVETTESYEDVIEVTRKICDLMKDQLKEIEEQQKIKVRVLVPGADGSEEGDSQGNSDENDEENTEEADITIILKPQKNISGEEKPGQKNENPQVESQEKENDESGKETNQTGQGASRNENPQSNLEEQIRSLTDDAYKKNEKHLFDTSKNAYVYANVPVFDLKKIMDYKDVIKYLAEDEYKYDNKVFNEYKKESSKVVSYLVKEFELRKNADQMKRAQSAKTGELNMNRLYSYNFTGDIFEKITVVPQGQSHGLIMFLDWSGSMVKHIGNTVKQLLNLAMFCKKVNIPFEVYSFVESTKREHMFNHLPKNGDLYMPPFGLINLLSSRMRANEFTLMASALMVMSGANHKYSSRYNVRTPYFMAMNGTPLNEAVIAAMEIVPNFQKNNRLQIVNTVFLTDGEGSMLKTVSDGLFQSTRSFSHMIIRDPKTRYEEMFESNHRNFNPMVQTDALVKLLKYRTNSHVIGFFVGESRDVVNRVYCFWPEAKQMEDGDRENFIEKVKEDFRKNSSIVVTNTGFDDYYILRSNGLDTDDDEELTFKENATTRGMVTAFSKYAGNKISSRVILNRFISLIS